MNECLCPRYNREEVVASLGREINLNPPLTLGQLPDTSEELLKLDQVAFRYIEELLKLNQVAFRYIEELLNLDQVASRYIKRAS